MTFNYRNGAINYRDNSIYQVRQQFVDLLLRQQYVVDKTGAKMLEIPGASFLAKEETIFDNVNHDYVAREIQWYESQSLCVDDIPGGPPEIWKQVASKGYHQINSNYGYLIFSPENGSQFDNVFMELLRSPTSRRAVMIYTRPSMHYDYNQDGMSDFICTNAVQFLLRHNHLDVVVQMRSNDGWAGYRNDRAWQKYIQKKMVDALNAQSELVGSGEPPLQCGDIYWQVGSLHFYERQFYLIDHYWKSGEISIKKNEYRKKYPDSPWC